MKVDKETLMHVAEVARLNLNEDEIKKFLVEMNEIIESFSTIDKLDTSGVKPSFQPVEIRNSFREDRIEKSFTQEDALRNSKQTKDGYFKGPKSI